MNRDRHHTRRLVLCAFAFVAFVCLAPITSAAQKTGVVKAINANLRGTPSVQGEVMVTAPKGERFEIIQDKAPWYLIQTSKYVGWIHGNAIDLTADDDSFTEMFVRQQSRPKTTTKPPTGGESVFQSEYVGIDYTIIEVVNNAGRTLTLTFGGVKHVIAAGTTRTLEADGGNYDYFASAPGVRSVSGVETFAKGYKYSWTFYVVRR